MVENEKEVDCNGLRLIVRHAWYLARYRKCVVVFRRVESEGNCHHSKQGGMGVLKQRNIPKVLIMGWDGRGGCELPEREERMVRWAEGRGGREDLE